MRMRIKEEGKKGVRLFIPIFIIWILVFALLIAVLPLLILAAIFTWRQGLGFKLLLVYPLFFSILWSMSGLYVEVKERNKDILFYFK
jgi:hypothetical protein